MLNVTLPRLAPMDSAHIDSSHRIVEMLRRSLMYKLRRFFVEHLNTIR